MTGPHANSVALKWTWCQLAHCSSSSILEWVQPGKHSTLHCMWFKMDDSFSTALKCIKQGAVIEFWMHENEIPIRIHWRLLAFHGEDNVDVLCIVGSENQGRVVEM